MRRGLTPRDLHEARTNDRVVFHCDACSVVYDGALATAEHPKPYVACVAGVGPGRRRYFRSAADALAWIGDHEWTRYHVRSLAVQREMMHAARCGAKWPRIMPAHSRPRVVPQPRAWECTEDGYNDYNRPLVPHKW